ncbi:MAG: FkbM family methyltransferase [Methylacidiphilales bacterium]|nr:FkbM family methyltransferase [Candidatus Methylacidiphilales bacterium]
MSDSGISRELIRDCVGREDPTILEIGCNDGTDTLRFLEMFKNPKIYCFEPDPRAIARFKAKVGERSNVHLYEMALSDRNGEATFYQSGGRKNVESAQAMPEGWDMSGSIRPPKEHLKVNPWVTFDRKISVRTSTLDSWLRTQGIATVDFIWLDVQGAEMDVFRGGSNTLASTRFIYTEYSNQELYKGQPNLRQLMKYLREFNFDILARYRNDVLFVNKRFA